MTSATERGPALTVRAAAARAGVSAALVYAWVAEGRLAHARLGRAGRRGRIAIAPADLDALLGECRVDRRPPRCEPGDRAR